MAVLTVGDAVKALSKYHKDLPLAMYFNDYGINIALADVVVEQDARIENWSTTPGSVSHATTAVIFLCHG
jgi:hypothetical protein